MTTFKNLCVAERYTDKQGNEKTSWTTIGRLYTKDDGRQNIAINVIPLGWNGIAQVFDSEKKEQSESKPQPKQSQLPWDE